MLVNLALDFLVDVLLELHELQLYIQDAQELHGTDLHVSVLEQFHLLLKVLDLNGSGYEIHQELKVVDGLERTD